MDTLYKQSLAALVAAALALGCGSSDKQNQQAKEPSASTMSMPATPSTSATSTTETTSGTTTGSASQGTSTTASGTSRGERGEQPLQPSAGGGGPQDTGGLQPSSQNADATSTTTTMPATMDTIVTTLSDGEVFAIESAINKGEITLADLAKKKAVTGEVKTFAATLAAHHREAQAKANTIAKKEKISANPGDLTKKLDADASATAADLEAKKGRAFDTAYVDSQVRMHRDAGALIDSQLLPSAKNAALKDQLTNVRSTISDHLSKAQEIQSHLDVVGTSTSSTGTTPASSKAKTPGRKTDTKDVGPKTSP